MAIALQSRVVNLEGMMAELTQNVNRLSLEMREFKEEMREFKEEMREFKDEMREFKDEMREFKDEMREFKVNTQEALRQSRREWGELSRRLGTMAEDLVAPSIPRITQTVLNCPPEAFEMSAVRVVKQHPVDRGRNREFDVVAVCGDYLLINETKSKMKLEYIEEFVEKTLPEAREFFPKYQDKKVVGCIASLYVDASLVKNAEKRGLIVLGFGEDVMDVLNSPGFVPRTF